MMNTQPDYHRLLRTINRQEPDRVPLAELALDVPVMQQFLGRPLRTVADHIAFWSGAGYDYIYLRPAYEYAGVAPVAATGTPLAWQASAAEGEQESISTTLPGLVHSHADLDTYPWPDPQTVDCSNQLCQ